MIYDMENITIHNSRSSTKDGRGERERERERERETMTNEEYLV